MNMHSNIKNKLMLTKHAPIVKYISRIRIWSVKAVIIDCVGDVWRKEDEQIKHTYTKLISALNCSMYIYLSIVKLYEKMKVKDGSISSIPVPKSSSTRFD
jgi:hypothetical protein